MGESNRRRQPEQTGSMVASFGPPLKTGASETRESQRGVSLIEALLALAVMGIGMLGLMGVQSTLRGYSDIAKQRSEAVRLAQAETERWRGFSALVAPPGGAGTYLANLPAGTVPDAPVAGSNADFTLSRTVTDLALPPGAPLAFSAKALTVDVVWNDRTGLLQNVRITSILTAIAPELPLTLVVPSTGDVVSRPQGRQRAIPTAAKDLGDGSSGFIPPGAASGVVWRFDHFTGLITVCSTTAPTTDLLTVSNVMSCATTKSILVSGFVRYSLGSSQLTAINAAALLYAPSTPLLQVIAYNNPFGAPVPSPCNMEHVSPTPPLNEGYSAFYCAVPAVTPPAPNLPNWTGSLEIATTSLASNPADFDISKLKVCRFQLSSYSGQTAPLANQNFLVIRAGDGATAFTCPAPTSLHQP